MAVLCSMVAAGSGSAQTRIGQSALAGVTLPVAARDWSADPDGAKAATLDLAASLAGLVCAEREAHAWPAADRVAAERLGMRTDAAFVTAGWRLEPISRTPEGQRMLLARRLSERLVLVWQPEEAEVGLLLCRAEARAEEPAAPIPPPADSTAPAAPIDDAPPAVTVEPPAPPAEPAAPAIGTPVETPSPPPAIATQTGASPPAGAFNLPLRMIAVGLLALGGIGLIGRDIRGRRRNPVWRWPTAIAVIERGWVEEEEREDRLGEPTHSYMPVLQYRYRVDDEEFEGANIGVDDRPQPTPEAARRILARYPDFSSVEVHYDSADPSFAVIEVDRPQPGRDFYFGLAAFVLALGLLLTLFL